jgi:hypothetical protein
MNGPTAGEAGAVATARLLWEACRRDPEPTAIWRSLEQGADLRQAVELAAAHRLVPLLRRALGEAGALDELGPEREVLDTAADLFKMEALLLIPPAVSLAVHPLTDAGLEPVVLKGPAVASRYVEPGLRPMDDIDVLLPATDHPRALEALQGAGWRVSRAAAADLYDTVLTHAEVPTLLLELHYGLERTSQRGTKLDPLALWKLRRPMECAGTAAFGLPLTQELVVLAAHAGKPYHRFGRLVWIADLAMIVGDAARRGTPVDWDEVRALAEESRCRTVLAVALAMAQRAGVAVPPGVFELPKEARNSPALRPLLSETWPLVAGEHDGFGLDYRLSMADRRTQRAKLRAVYAASNHGIRARLRQAVVAPRRVLGRATRAA